MNYGTSLGKKSFINATASFQLRGQTGRAKDATGKFNAFNAIEQRAAEAELISIAYLVT
jgi:iron complex outermembrane receptor protein